MGGLKLEVGGALCWQVTGVVAGLREPPV